MRAERRGFGFKPAVVCTENINPHVMVMTPAKAPSAGHGFWRPARYWPVLTPSNRSGPFSLRVELLGRLRWYLIAR